MFLNLLFKPFTLSLRHNAQYTHWIMRVLTYNVRENTSLTIIATRAFKTGGALGGVK